MVWLLTALKVIGIILLCVLGIVIILACLVLFVPIKYKYKFDYIDDRMNSNCHYVDVSWLFQIIRCRIKISLSGIYYKTRLFGIRTKWLDKIISKESDDYNDDECDSIDKDTDKLSTSDDNDESTDEEFIDEIESIWEDVAKAEDELKAALGEDAGLLQLGEQSETETDEAFYDDIDCIQDNDLYKGSRKKKTIKKALRRLIAWLKSKLRVLNPKVWLKILVNKLVALGKFIDKLKNSITETISIIIRRYNLIVEFLDKKSTVMGIDKSKSYIEKTCKHVLPRKKKIVLHIGFDDPSLTGKALAVLGLVYAKFGRCMEVYPNFSEKELKASVLFKGRIRGITALIIGIRIIKDKAIKRLLRNIKMVKEEW